MFSSSTLHFWHTFILQNTFFKADTFKLSSFQHTNCPCLPWWRPPACFSKHSICYYTRCKTVLEWQLSLRRGQTFPGFVVFADVLWQHRKNYLTISNHSGQDRKWHFFKSQLFWFSPTPNLVFWQSKLVSPKPEPNNAKELRLREVFLYF